MASSDSHDDSLVAQWVDRARRGETDAFDALVRHLESPLLGFLRARRVDDPQGTANEVLVRVFRSIGGFDGSVPEFRAWVFRIARNLVVDEARRRSRRVQEFATAPTELPPAGAVGDGFVERIDEASRIERLLDGLTADQRDVVILRVIAELSVAETAEILEREPGTVRVLQHRALEKLRRGFSESV